MGRLNERIDNATDSYYVSHMGYRRARARARHERENMIVCVFLIFIGMYIFILDISKFWGAVMFILGVIFSWAEVRRLKNR